MAIDTDVELASPSLTLSPNGESEHAHRARRQRRDDLQQLARAARWGASALSYPWHPHQQGKHVLGEIDTQSDNGHGLPLSNELMRFRTSNRGTSLPLAAMRLVRDGEVPFIRQGP
jgi:hypothetical protein